MRILFYKISKTFKQIKLKLVFLILKKVQKLRFTGKFLVKRAFTKLNVYSRFTVFFCENTVKIEEKQRIISACRHTIVEGWAITCSLPFRQAVLLSVSGAFVQFLVSL
jgi:hypothetical protein